MIISNKPPGVKVLNVWKGLLIELSHNKRVPIEELYSSVSIGISDNKKLSFHQLKLVSPWHTHL